jgi:predicted DNA binding protein
MIQLQFMVPPETWIESLCQKDLATVKILSMKVLSSDVPNVTHFVDIVSDKVDAEDLIKELQKSPDVIESDVAKVGSNRLVGAVTSKGCRICSIIMDSKTGYFIGPALSTSHEGQMSYKLFMSGDAIPQFLQTLHSKGVEYKISDISRLAPKRALTAKQEKVLKSALELGYYDFPKRISTEELAKIVGGAPSTITEILRRAERRIISGFFDGASEDQGSLMA